MRFGKGILIGRSAAVCAVLAAAGWAHHHWVAPLSERASRLEQELATVQQKGAAARAEIRALRQEEQDSAAARQKLSAVHGAATGEPAIVWVPATLKGHLQRFGLSGVDVRQNTAAPAAVRGYEHTYWHLQLPPQEGRDKLNAILLAAAELEEKTSLRVLELSIVAEAEPPCRPSGALNVSAFVPR